VGLRLGGEVLDAVGLVMRPVLTGLRGGGEIVP
jgi:hypothetical protein